MMKKKRFLFFLMFLMLLQAPAWGATYYIDYAGGADSNAGTSKTTPWKHQPYMVGFTGTYTHSAGDIFIFKGGVTWAYSAADHIFPMTIKAGGATGNPDQYAVDKTWYAGTSYMPPVFDGCQTAEGLNVCALNGAATLGKNSWLVGDDNGVFSVSNIVINGLQLQDIGAPVTAGGDASGSAIAFENLNAIAVENCIISPHAAQAFAFSNYNNGSPQNESSIYVHDNQISYAGRGVIYGYPGYTVNDVRVYNNKWEGPGLTLASDIYNYGGYHNDGLMVGCPAGCIANAVTVTNIEFNNNLFNGQWEHCTAQYYSNGGTGNTSIYDNVFSIENNSSNGSPMQDFVDMGYSSGFADWGTINVYNNTFSSDALVGYNKGVNNGFAINYPSTASPLDISVKNNIFSGVATGVIVGPGTWTSLAIDGNLYNVTTSGGYGHLGYINGTSYNSLSAACAAGYDCNSLGGNNYSSSYPGFTLLPNGTLGSGNWQLQPGSPAIKEGTDLSSVFTVDLAGNQRPSNHWDMGAYQTYYHRCKLGAGGRMSTANGGRVLIN